MDSQWHERYKCREFSKVLHTLRFYITICFKDLTIDILTVFAYVYMLSIVASIFFLNFNLFPCYYLLTESQQ